MGISFKTSSFLFFDQPFQHLCDSQIRSPLENDEFHSICAPWDLRRHNKCPASDSLGFPTGMTTLRDKQPLGQPCRDSTGKDDPLVAGRSSAHFFA